MRSVDVTLIRPGVSANGNAYSPELLANSTPLWAGATAFVDHPTALDNTRAGGRSVRDIVGVYRAARWQPTIGVRATLDFAPGAEWLARLVEAAIAQRDAGQPAPNIGVSADMVVTKRPTRDDAGRPIWTVTSIRRVNSVDVVFDPSAGGSFDRIVEAEWQAGGPEREARQVEVFPMHATNVMTSENTPRAATGATPTPGHPIAAVNATPTVALAIAQELLEARLTRLDLPDVAARAVRRRLAGRAFEANELDAEIEEVRGLLGAGVAGVVRGHGAPRDGSVVAAMRSPGDRLQSAFDRLFGVVQPDGLSDTPRLSGIREAYLATLGLAGQPTDWIGLGFGGGEARTREANETVTTMLPNLLRNSMTKRLIQDYRAQPRWWEPVVTIATINDLKAQDRIRLNDFGALATVNENAAYANVQWSDARETYTPAKRGNTVAVTLEAILNDDTHGITRIPAKLAAAATVTINEFVANLLTSNPFLSDGFAVYDATNHGGNAGTAALDATALQNGVAAVMKQTNSAGKRIGVRPRFLIVPVDLLWTALTLVNSALKPGTNNNDVNVLQGALTVIAAPNFTDANDWYLQTDPREVEGVEVGFLNGQQEPELLVQDQPTAGAAFTNDAITFKIRWIFGGGWLDYRGAYRSAVAG